MAPGDLNNWLLSNNSAARQQSNALTDNSSLSLPGGGVSLPAVPNHAGAPPGPPGPPGPPAPPAPQSPPPRAPQPLRHFCTCACCEMSCEHARMHNLETHLKWVLAMLT